MKGQDRQHATFGEQLVIVGLGIGTVFWLMVFYVALQPEHLLEYPLVAMLAIGYSLLLPILLNMLVPVTPAGQLLQSTRWRTVGFAVTLVAAVFMIVQAYMIIYGYMSSKPVIVAANNQAWFSIGMLVLSVIFPALSIQQVTPQRWLYEMKVARDVETYKMLSKARLVAMQARHVYALSLIRRATANEVMTLQDAQEVRTFLEDIHLEENAVLGQIVATVDDILGAKTGISVVEDQRVRDTMNNVADRLYLLTDAAAHQKEDNRGTTN